MSYLTDTEIAGMRTAVDTVQLAMRCTIQRREAISEDRYGQPIYEWAVSHADLPCWYWERKEQDVLGPDVQVIITDSRVAMPALTDVRAEDVISDITGVDGTTVAGPLRIIEVLDRVVDTVAVVRELKGEEWQASS